MFVPHSFWVVWFKGIHELLDSVWILTTEAAIPKFLSLLNEDQEELQEVCEPVSAHV